MTEEQVKQDITMTEQQVDEINKEIQDSNQKQIDEAVNKAKESTDAELEQMRKELAELQAKNAAIEAAKKLEEEKAALKLQLEKERAYQEQVNKKHVVAPSINPIQNQTTSVEQEVRLTPEQEWAEFTEKSKSGQFRASIPIDEFRIQK